MTGNAGSRINVEGVHSLLGMVESTCGSAAGCDGVLKASSLSQKVTAILLNSFDARKMLGRCDCNMC